MKKDFLFPHSCRIWGWITAGIFGIPGILFLLNTSIFSKLNWIDEVLTIGLLIGLLLIAFSKERDEDEYTTRIRAASLVWAIIANIVIIVIATLTLYSFLYLYFMIVEIFIPIILYIIKFKIAIYQSRKESSHAE